MNLARVLYQDPFTPKLFSSPSLPVTQEQKDYIKKVLEKSSSDSRFAEKAYAAISLILTGGSVKVPVVSSLTPNSAEIGDPSFTLHVHGTNFTSLSKIIFNGYEEPTTFVSATEVTTGVDMSVWNAPATLPVGVMSADGVMSDVKEFSFTDGTEVQSRQSSPVLSSPVPHKDSLVGPHKDSRLEDRIKESLKK